MERLVRSIYKKKSGYVFAKKAEDIAREYGIDRVARLGSNENPEPLSPAVQEAAGQALLNANRYPDECAQGILWGPLLCHWRGYGWGHRDRHPNVGRSQ